ncbi:MAG: hypothetical protein AAB557_03480 [Patescibacteria group bacterium]
MKRVMIPLSYTTSPLLSDFLRDIDTIRQSILCAPIPLSVERALEWRASLARIHGTLALTQSPVSIREISHTLTRPAKKTTASDRQLIIASRETFVSIRHQWTGSPKIPTTETILDLAQSLYPSRKEKVRRRIAAADGDITQMLRYVQAKPDHPVTTAATIHIALLLHPPIEDDAGILPRAVASLILAKHGYDLRGMAAVEASFGEHPDAYRRAAELARTQPTITSWLEYAAGRTRMAYRTLWEEIETIHREPFMKRSEDQPLTDRQKHMLELLANPTSTLSNSIVQKHFRVSQITASRDLARLSSLGLLYPHGKGRAVYYTRV